MRSPTTPGARSGPTLTDARPRALVTGASSFAGRWVVRALRRRGVPVRACVEEGHEDGDLARDPGVERAVWQPLDREALSHAVRGVETVYHFHELTDPASSLPALNRENVAVTRDLWSCAARNGVRAALYCSNAVVYGLLSRSGLPRTETDEPRAVEPYGRSKLMGEAAALEIGAQFGVTTVILRPAAMFGPGGHSPFAQALRDAAHSRLLFADAFRGRSFSFVHVEDVADAAVHLMHAGSYDGHVFNVAASPPIEFDEAFRAYGRALRRSERRLLRERFVAALSNAAQRIPGLRRLLRICGVQRLAFSLWRRGFDTTYSSQKLIDTSFRFRWTDFEEVLVACIADDARADGTTPLPMGSSVSFRGPPHDLRATAPTRDLA